LKPITGLKLVMTFTFKGLFLKHILHHDIFYFTYYFYDILDSFSIEMIIDTTTICLYRRQSKKIHDLGHKYGIGITINLVNVIVILSLFCKGISICNEYKIAVNLNKINKIRKIYEG
jgi:hypothetical protein